MEIDRADGLENDAGEKTESFDRGDFQWRCST
jgi:hypothetical protein